MKAGNIFFKMGIYSMFIQGGVHKTEVEDTGGIKKSNDQGAPGGSVS